MPTTANAIKKLKAAGFTITKGKYNKTIATLKNAVVEINDQDGTAIIIRVKRLGQQDDGMTDYYPGTFCHTIKYAIERAERINEE